MAELADWRFCAFAAMSDEQVVLYAKQGSQSATRHLISKYQNLVEGKARSYFLVGAEHEDVVQEGMIGLFKAIRDFSDAGLSAFRSFAELCITRQIITAIKTATRQKHSPLNSSTSIEMPLDDVDGECILSDTIALPAFDEPHGVVKSKQVFRQMGEHIERDLSQLEASALLQYLAGKTYQEIARDLGCNVKQIDNALQRAKKKIGRKLQLDIELAN
jgi:RNA polymerase sporulation-specific sigma factor